MREKAELYLAWKRVEEDMRSGTLGSDFEAAERSEIATHLRNAMEALHDEVWASYRHALIADSKGAEGIREIDLGAGHSSAVASLSARVVAALKAEGLLNESVGAGYLERNWPPALKDTGAWPLKSLRQAFLDGTLTRLPDPEEVLRRQIVGFIEKGDFGLGSGQKNGGYQRIWFKEAIGPEEVTFDDKTFLLTSQQARTQKLEPTSPVSASPPEQGGFILQPPITARGGSPTTGTVRICLRGAIPPEQWNRLGTKLLPKLRTAGKELTLGLDAALSVRAEDLAHVEADLGQALRDLGLEGLIHIERQ